MPLLTPLRLRGSRDPVLKEANYFQYLPHSREARSSRGQACETFLQPASLPAQSCPVLLSPTFSLLPLAHLSLLLPHFALLSFFFLVLTSVFITLSNILLVIYLFIYLFFGQKQAAIQPFISDFCVAGGDVGVVLLAYFKVVATAMLTALEAQLGFTTLPVTVC